MEGSGSGKPEDPETIYIKLEPTQSEERLQEHARGYRASNIARLAGGVGDTHDVPSAAELVNVQGIASLSDTSAVRISLNDVVSTPRRDMEYRTDGEQVISNDLVTIQENATGEKAE